MSIPPSTIKIARELIEDQQEQINKIIGVRSNVVNAIKKEFSDTDLSISVDPRTGSITFDSNLLFAVDRSDLSASGREFLEQFLTMYFNELLSDSFGGYVSEISVKGHTDTNGGYMYNLRLSQDRALVERSCIS